MNNWTFDLSVDGARYVHDDYRQGALVTIVNHGQLVLPATVEIDFQGGGKTRLRIPVETWMTKATYTLHVESTRPIDSVTIDPDQLLPDDDRGNNVFKMTQQ
jgi:hypothetical protein